jgi:hypothetical protein
MSQHIAGGIGYKTQEQVTPAQMEGKVFGAVMTLVIVVVGSTLLVWGLHTGLQKTEANLKARYETTR